jgi:hypothetical protein
MLLQTGRGKLSETGLQAPDNSVVALIDLQPQILFDVSHFHRQSITNNTPILATSTSVVDVPVVLSTVEAKSSRATCGRGSRRYTPAGRQSSVHR